MLPRFMRTLVERSSPFGALRVLEDTVQRAHVLVSDETFHGWQFRDPARLDEPTAYYAEASPIADLFRALPARARVAVAGLGAGSMAALAAPDHTLTFYEIDPVVVELARDPAYFSFLERSKARCDVVEGDALVTLCGALAGSYDLVVIDAFFGGAVTPGFLEPAVVARLATTLAESGIVAFHITSTSLGHDHRPALAEAARGLACVSRDAASPRLAHDPTLEIDPAYDLSMPVESRWAALSRDHAKVAQMVATRGWVAHAGLDPARGSPPA